MSVVGNLSRHLHFDEFNDSLQTGSGWLSPEQRKALARTNLGLSGGTAGVTPQAAPVALTDSTGGTASATLAAIAAGSSYAQADLTAIKNALASLAKQVTDLKTALTDAGVLS
jgi:hypothetical protein